VEENNQPAVRTHRLCRCRPPRALLPAVGRGTFERASDAARLVVTPARWQNVVVC
jgi:hypothetical protein